MFYEEFERYVKEKPLKGQLFIGVLFWSVGDVRLLGLSEEKERAYLGSFFLNQKKLKIKSVRKMGL